MDLKDMGLHNTDHRAPKLLKDSSSNQWSHWREASSAQVKNVITILSYFNKLTHSFSPPEPLTTLFVQQHFTKALNHLLQDACRTYHPIHKFSFFFFLLLQNVFSCCIQAIRDENWYYIGTSFRLGSTDGCLDKQSCCCGTATAAALQLLYSLMTQFSPAG